MFSGIKTTFLLTAIRRATRPRAAFRRALALRIASELVARGSRPLFWEVFAPRRLAIPVAVVVLFSTLGTSTYAYTSASVTDGHVLYPVRQAVEVAEAAVAITPEAKSAMRLRQADRRLIEAGRMLEKRPAQAAATLRKIEAAMEKSASQAQTLPLAKKTRALKKIDAEDAKVTAQLEQFAKAHPRAARAVVRERMERSVERLERQMKETADDETRNHLELRLERRQRLLEKVTPAGYPERGDE